MISSLQLSVLLFWFSLALWIFDRKRRSAPCPPGPPRLPILGNALDFPRTRTWEKFSEWSKIYGDIVYLNVFGSSIVILNSASVAKDLLDKRSATYSGRPSLAMASMVGFDRSMALLDYGEEWRYQRKLIAPHFSAANAFRYHFVQEAEARRLVCQLNDDPARFESHCKWRIANIISRVTYGFYLTSKDDPFYILPLELMEIFAGLITPGKWIVDVLPFLRYLPKRTPGARFVRVAAEWRRHLLEVTWSLYTKSKSGLEAGTAIIPNVCADIIDNHDTTAIEDERRIALAAFSALGGGLDTNMSAILIFLLLMLHYPDVQAKGFEEITRIVGKDRLPDNSDQSALPYIRSIVIETLRFHPPAVMSGPHSLHKDDIYNGMFIPKGSIVIGNIWHILHDPENFPEPHTFKPERYNNSEAEMAKVTDVVFGFGRRVCPGSAFAQGTLFAIISTVLATSEVIPACDENGKEIIPPLLFTSDTISTPEPYQCRFRYRSERAERLLRENVSIE